MTKKEDKQLMKMFLGLYIDCMTYKEKYPHKNISCDIFKDNLSIFIKRLGKDD